MAGNSSRKGAVRGGKKGQTVGSGGKGKAKLSGRGPTPKAADRPYHPAAKAKARAAKKTVAPRTAASAAASAAAKPPRSKGVGSKAASTGSAAASRGRTGSKATSTRGAASRPSGGRTSSPQGRGRGAKRPAHEWVSGRNAVLEALQAGVPVDVVYVMSSIDVDDRVRDILNLGRGKRLQMLEVSRTDLDRMTSRMVHQGVAARVPAFTYSDPTELMGDAGNPALVVAVDGLTDPRNLGAIIRSAAAFDASGVVVPQRRAVGVTPATWKTSAGAASRVKVAQATNLVRALQDYKKAGCFIVGLSGDGDSTISEAAADFLSGPAVVVVGAEGAGLSRLVRETCDVIASIPIASTTESLNASVATSIALYEAAQSRRR